MFALVTIGNIVAFGAGGALVWFFKDKILQIVMGANALSAKLHAKADALVAATKRL